MRGPDLAQKRDFYEVLGLRAGAAATEIKAAYRRLARKYHPDVNSGDHAAEERFKEVNEAYEVLSDPDRRERYDRFGHAGVNGNADVGFGAGMGPMDLFDLVFGSGRGGRARGPERGADLRVDIELTLEECATGVERTIPVTRYETCSRCSGSGARPDSAPETCGACRGSGQVRATQNTFLGSFSTVATCSRCGGRGRVVRNPCVQCHGAGVEQKRAAVRVKVPAGVDDGQRLVLRREGEAGPEGGPAGDLYVFIHARSHPTFERHGLDLVCEVRCSMVRAALGGEIEVPTLEGQQRLLIGAGTQPGDMFRVRGFGMPEPNSNRRGDLLVVVRVETPSRLNDRQRKALEEFARASGETPEGHDGDGGGLIEWVRNIFGARSHQDD